jgi:hypothetical protein
MTINPDKLRSPPMVFIIYVLASGLLIMIFRFILPGSEAPLLLYSREWRFIKGFLEFFNLFPALALSALVIPFGFYSLEQNYQSFSDVFFKRLIVSVTTAICAAVIYAIIFFLLLPMVKNSEENIRYRGELYQLAKTQIQERRNAGEWLEASQFLGICDSIWPNSPELAELRIEIEINLERLRSEEHMERFRARTALELDRRSSNPWMADISGLSEDRQPLNTTQAISMGIAAFEERRFFEAHWLFTIGERLAVRGGPEAANAAALASDAWNMISSLAPNLMEQRLYNIFSLKLSGYQAMNIGDWIRAYYIFRELLSLTPDDPDAVNFLAASERGAKEYAFFIDEMNYSLGEILTGAVFSIPVQNGRAVLRFSHLRTTADFSYGMEFEYMSFDAASNPLASVRSRYAKILPIVINENSPQVLVLTHALDRYDQNNNFEGEWLLGSSTPGGILLDISYEDLLLLSYIRRGLTNLQIDELHFAAGKVGNAGYVYQIFHAEILNRLGSALFFLPLAIFIIVLSWRYRIKSKPRYIFVLMLPVLPVVFNGLVFLYRSVFNTVGIWLVLSIGFAAALAVYIVILALSLFISLIILSAQHS